MDKTYEKVKEMINNGEWDTNDKLKENLTKQLNIQHNSRDPVDETTLRQILKDIHSHDSVDETTLRRVLNEILKT
jgi:hypothetical protein